jgi:PDZ domain
MMLKPVLALCFAAGSLNLPCMADEQVKSENKEPQVVDVVVEQIVKSESDEDDRPVEVRVERIVRTESHSDKDGNTKVVGKIVIMGPDGKVKEYSLDDELPDGVRVMISGANKHAEGATASANAFVFHSDEAEVQERMMIGVHCDAADDVLRSQLKLDGSGLVVLAVIDESPAKAAGMIKGDVVFRANGSGLNSVEQLVELVQNADGDAIEFGVIRGGDRIEIIVSPEVMKTTQHVVLDRNHNIELTIDGDDPELKWIQKLQHLDLPEEALNALKKGRTGVRLRSLHPGIVIDRNARAEDIQKLVDEVRARAQVEVKRATEAQEQASVARKKLHLHLKEAGGKAQAESIEQIHEQMQDLHAQMAKLQKALEQLSKEDKN